MTMVLMWINPVSTTLSNAAEWQWSTEVESVVSSETNAHPRAFLWIPPGCTHVRAVVVGQHNMEEEGILEHPEFRRVMAELGIAEVWVTPGLDLVFDYNKGAGEKFDGMMKSLADISGYQELALAPVIPIGHSAAASYPWNFAAWNPERTLAAISISGQWPWYVADKMPSWEGKNIDGVPGLVTIGEYEWAGERGTGGLKLRQDHPELAMSVLAEPGAGHFDFSDDKVKFIALYIRKACEYRLPSPAPRTAGTAPANGAVELKPIKPGDNGWLVDRWRGNSGPKAPSAPVGNYSGDPAQAYWTFDGEMAKATEELQAKYRGQKVCLLGYLQKDGITDQNPKMHGQVPLKFEPSSDDGITFNLKGAFLDAVPDGRPARWVGQEKGAVVEHPPVDKAETIVISRICGPVVKLGDDTFSMRFYRMGMNNPRRSNDIWLVATYAGDDDYRRIVQQAQLRFPLRNDKGEDQVITFPTIADQKQGAAPVQLAAKSSSGMQVYYYVREGPVEIEGDKLVFTTIPPRSAFPVKVTVVAWQWGRSTDPKVKTAEPVTQTFLIAK
ncbi:MAG: hypothetical protein ACAI35_25750 [Candidatus Methylacidiphilales bacterium]|nr:hypothetical protein [Candidatus Methylacidiphilales bacterium]